LAKNNDDWELFYNLGVALGDQQRFQEEVEAYKKGLAINPTHAESWTNIGIALANQGDTSSALKVRPFLSVSIPTSSYRTSHVPSFSCIHYTSSHLSVL
jgi:tetratricopeptide (TPR) repeat protein